MTTAQLATIAFGDSMEVARHRLLTLHRLGLISRFRPIRLHGEGSAPYHYTLGPAGAALLASARTTTVRALGYDPGDILALAHSPRLAHIVGVSDVLASLVSAARRRGASLAAWWSERRCTAHWGAVVRPDACGRWREDGVDGHFFLEYDRGSETTERVAAKVADYARLASLTGHVSPVLVWLIGDRREVEVRRALSAVRADTVPVLTGHSVAGLGLADAVWLPLEVERRVTLRTALLTSCTRQTVIPDVRPGAG
jgi:Replication-relaxation